MAIALANSRDGEGRLSMASPSQWSSFDQHQREMRTGRGNPWGSCAPLLVADYQPQDWMASRHAGFLSIVFLTSLKTCPGLRGSGLSHSHWSRLSSRTATNCGVSCTMHALPRIHSMRVVACKRSRAHTLPYQQLVKCLADRRHFPKALSSGARLVGIDPNERRLTNAQRSFAPGAKAND